jgi:hypothetical protein
MEEESMTNGDCGELARLKEESGRAHERRYTLLYWSIILLVGVQTLIAAEGTPLSVLLLPPIMTTLLMWLDSRIKGQILDLETYREVFFEAGQSGNSRERARTKYFELEEREMSLFRGILHRVFEHSELQICYSVLSVLCLIIAWAQVRETYLIPLILVSFITALLVLHLHYRYYRLNSERRSRRETWQNVKQELELRSHDGTRK